jgi:methionyl-tRNA synthetase
MAWNDGGREKYVLPANVPANEFLNFEGEKFSKSRGWGIDVRDFLARYPADPLRYYLAVTLPEYRDADFTWREFQAKNNNELADILGNFVNRTLAFTLRNFGGKVPARGALSDMDRGMLETLAAAPVNAGAMFEAYRFKDAVAAVVDAARAANKYFNDSEPWKSAKTDPARCGTTLNVSLQVCRALAVLLSPIVPATAERLWRMLGLEGEAAAQEWDACGSIPLPEGHRIGSPEILVSKIEDKVIEEEIARLPRAAVEAGSAEPGAAPPAGLPPAPPPIAPPKPTIPIDDFGKVDLRIARVLSCEAVPKSTKLLKLQVEVGTERRQIVAGIAQHYAPADLVGKSIVVVFNLAPAKLMGQESQGMLLAASDGGGKLVILAPSAEIGSGSVVK